MRLIAKSEPNPIPMDQLRLVCVYYLSAQNVSKEDIELLEKELVKAGLEEWELSCFRWEFFSTTGLGDNLK